MGTSLTRRLQEIIMWSDKDHQDAVENVLEYFREKDTRMTRDEVERIVARIRSMKPQHQRVQPPGGKL